MYRWLSRRCPLSPPGLWFLSLSGRTTRSTAWPCGGDRLCSLALLFIGFNIFASGLFTALSNGVISAVLAFSRSFVFMSAAMLALPAMLGVDGVWLATPAAELAAFLLSALTLIKYRKRYHY